MKKNSFKEFNAAEKLCEIKQLAELWENEKKRGRPLSQDTQAIKRKLFNLLGYYGIYDNEHNYRILGINDDYYVKINSVNRFISEIESLRLWKWYYKNDELDLLNGISYRKFLENISLEEFEKIVSKPSDEMLLKEKE